MCNNPLSIALQNAKDRTGKIIGTAVKNGLFQVQMVEYPKGKRRRSVITPLSGWILGSRVISVLDTIDADSIPAFAAAAKDV